MERIREIRKNVAGGQYQFDIIVVDKKKCCLNMRFVNSRNDIYSEHINFDITCSRLIQLADDILNVFHREAKLEEFKPKIEDLEKILEEKYGVENYVLDLVRMPNRKKEAIAIYKWLKSNEKWLYERSD